MDKIQIFEVYLIFNLTSKNYLIDNKIFINSNPSKILARKLLFIKSTNRTFGVKIGVKQSLKRRFILIGIKTHKNREVIISGRKWFMG